MENILTANITNWHRRTLQRVIKNAQNIMRTNLLSIRNIGEKRSLLRATGILKDKNPPQPQPVHPAAIWKDTEVSAAEPHHLKQLVSSDYETL